MHVFEILISDNRISLLHGRTLWCIFWSYELGEEILRGHCITILRAEREFRSSFNHMQKYLLAEEWRQRTYSPSIAFPSAREPITSGQTHAANRFSDPTRRLVGIKVHILACVLIPRMVTIRKHDPLSAPSVTKFLTFPLSGRQVRDFHQKHRPRAPDTLKEHLGNTRATFHGIRGCRMIPEKPPDLTTEIRANNLSGHLKILRHMNTAAWRNPSIAPRGEFER